MKKIILRSNGLKKHYGSGHTEVRAVDGIDLTVYSGEIVLIMGPSGSGKTSMLSMLGGLLSPNSGSVEIDGIDITSLPGNKLPQIRALKLGFVFQAFNLLEALTVEENILFPASLKTGGKKEAIERADDLISRLGLAGRRNALPKTLSGGEKQRVAIARALINEPPVILADEPTGNLDSKSGQEVMMILHDVARDEGCAVVIVTHDPRVEDIADRILWLEDGLLRDRKDEEHHWVYDPVCGMRIDEWTATLFSEYEETKYAFCSKRCKERFNETPESYLRLNDPKG
ncbi:MAG: ATP-binding cassette domain-containing protein [bacterium]|nr:ATP-binding cassette domain-containing protein [bacterium]